ncbi:MAG: YfcE family phosphodiesterase [Treponema sp.]|nr:YfcE family phosphodiesterase [Treponema sp.]
MNALTQDETLLIGSTHDIEILAQKETASILIISDSHGAKEKLKSILKERGSYSDALVFCGDGIGDLLSILLQAVYDDSVKQTIPPVIAIVQGNNDSGFYTLRNKDNKIKVPLTQIITVCGHKIFVTHGHRFCLYNGTKPLVMAAKAENAELVLYGHTHVALGEKNYGILTLNPGSCSRPRDRQLPCFAVLNIKKNSSSFGFMFYEVSGVKGHLYAPEFSGLW